VQLEVLKAFRLAPVEHRYTTKDTILYALGLGYGGRATDPDELRYVYERDLHAAPSMCSVLSHPGFWAQRPELGLDWIKLLHGEQGFQIHKPISPEGAVRGEYEMLAIEDKGADKGAVGHMVKRLFEVATGDLIATVTSTYMFRGDGGQGGFGTPPSPPEPLPEGEPDIVVDVSNLPQSALIYRLSGDYNPIHADPDLAAKAGFPRPILHGLCTFGMATRGVVDALCKGEPQRLTSLSARFSKPVFPGETLRTEIFRTEGGARFRARVLERDVVVLDRGSATVA
jgi:acyl dehydratase